MKAVRVKPGVPNTVHFDRAGDAGSERCANGLGRARAESWGRTVPTRRINAAEYGAAPKGYDF